jgi:hypothetical protein
MFGLLVFAAVLVALIAIVGPAYPQTWKQRWGN